MFTRLFSSFASETSCSKRPSFVSCSWIFLLSLLFSSKANSWDILLVISSFFTLFKSACKPFIVPWQSSHSFVFCSKLDFVDSNSLSCSVAMISNFISSSLWLTTWILASTVFSWSSSFCLFKDSIWTSYFTILLHKSWSSSSRCVFVLPDSSRSCCISITFSSSSIRRRIVWSLEVRTSSSCCLIAEAFSSSASTLLRSASFSLKRFSFCNSNEAIFERYEATSVSL